jgi:hypothetical protein
VSASCSMAENLVSGSGLQPAFGGDPSRHGNGGKHLGPEPALAVGAGAGRDRFGQGTLDRSDGVEELRLQCRRS